MKRAWWVVLFLVGSMSQRTWAESPETHRTIGQTTHTSEGRMVPQKATFAGGCFWCLQPPFDKLPGVLSTTVGYTGGTTVNPTYEEVRSGRTGHAESLEVTYDPSRVTYDQLLDVFWHNVDPTTPNQQFADRGTQYRTVIFYRDDAQRQAALASKTRWEQSGKFGKPIVTEIVAATTFYPAEEYHQRYYQKNSIHYKLYRLGSGRDGYLKRLWGR